MIALTLRTLLRLTPPSFRERYRDEILEVHHRRMLEQVGQVRRLAFGVREVAGLSVTVLRLWTGRTHPAANFGSAVHADGPGWSDASPAAGSLRGRWLGTPARSSERRTGALLAAGALLIFTGAGLGYGAGQAIGFALIPPALVFLAGGLLGRLSSAPRMNRRMVQSARLTAMSAVALALLIILMAVQVGPGAVIRYLRYPAVIGIEAGTVIFCLTGILLGELPVIPSVMASVGAALLATGVIGLERVAEVGVWLCVPGWMTLALTRWGPPARFASPGRVAD